MAGEYEEPTWGLVEEAELARPVVVSPHFDDAALGAAYLLMRHPGSTVITVFGGRPPAYPVQPTEWDAAGGFASGDDIVALRREEDLAAMEILGTAPCWLEFADHQYLAPEERPSSEEVASALAEAVLGAAATAVFIPMGLGNPDHVLAHEAGLAVMRENPGMSWFCYEDFTYKHIPGLLSWRAAKLLHSSTWATPAVVPQERDLERKRRAVFAYRSQIPPLEKGHALAAVIDGDVPEQYWRLAPPPRGWEALADLA